VHAIILSAGQGRRLLPLTAERPKCLIPFAGRTLLSWQLRALAAAGVRRATVVTGFRAADVEAEAAAAGADALHNPFFAVADNLASCWVARGRMEGPFLLLNGDTLAEPAALRRLLDAPPADVAVAIDRKDAYDADDMKVELDGARVLAVGKTLPAGRTHGESIGCLRFSPRGAERFRAGVEAALREDDALGRWYLTVVDRLAREGGVRAASVEGLGWGEVDTAADLDRAERLAAAWRARAA
jgi:choline kinase